MNKEELGIGFVLGLGFNFLIGLWAIPLAVITGFLYERGGSGWLGTKAWRRFGVPVAIYLSNGISPHIHTIISAVLSVIVLSLGYGQRDSSDPGSPLGNFWLDRLGVFWGKWASRATIVCGIWAVWYIGGLIK